MEICTYRTETVKQLNMQMMHTNIKSFCWHRLSSLTQG